MNTIEAKFILQARRPNGRDDGDQRFAAAFAQAQRDPALATWMGREQAFDAVVAEKLRAVMPPAELRAAILAGARMSRPVAWWRSPMTLAMAASAAVVLGLAAFWFRASPILDTEQLALGAMGEMSAPEHFPLAIGGNGELGVVLADPTTRLAAGLSMDFAQLKADGCRTLHIAGREVLEVCFMRGGEFHLYVALRGDFGGAKADVKPMFREQGTLASVTWTDARHAYVLVTEDGTQALRSIF
jgi:uncharacterized membrane protein YbaN (DUF454 family)